MIHTRYQAAAEFWQHDMRVLRFYAECRTRSQLSTAALALLKTQELPYRREDIDALKPPVRTMDEGGDCEDLAVLLVAGLRGLGLQALVIYMPMDGPQDHVSAMVRVDGKLLWAEPTLRAKLGEHPLDAAARLGERRW